MAKSAPLPKAEPDSPAGLADIQSLMASVLMRRLTPGENLQRLQPSGERTADVAATFIKPNDRLSSFDRLQIYNQQYWWRLLGCFGDDYRGVRAVLGQKRFDQLAVAYLESVGSHSWSLRDLGQHLPAFLAEHPERSAPHTALAIDMARVEWARVLAFDGPQKPPIDPQRLARIAPDRLHLGLQPYISLLELSHPIDHLIKRQREGEVETASASNAVGAAVKRAVRVLRAKASPTPIHLAVHRVEFSVYYKRLEPEAFALLTALRERATLADACELAFASSTADPEESATKLREWFTIWTRLGWLTK